MNKAVHNFSLTCPDGTTAAERFFGQKPRCMFAAILDAVERRGIPQGTLAPVPRERTPRSPPAAPAGAGHAPRDGGWEELPGTTWGNASGKGGLEA